MIEKYLSIITNFGCHYSCPYCVVKHNHIDVPETTIEGLSNLRQSLIVMVVTLFLFLVVVTHYMILVNIWIGIRSFLKFLMK